MAAAVPDAARAAPAPRPPAAAEEGQIGNLNAREVTFLQTECHARDKEKGSVIEHMILVASLVIALVTAVSIPGFTGLVVAGAIYFSGGSLLTQLYNRLRSHDYEEAGSALHTRNFKEFIGRLEINPTIDTIVQIHRQYKQQVAAEAERVLAARA